MPERPRWRSVSLARPYVSQIVEHRDVRVARPPGPRRPHEPLTADQIRTFGPTLPKVTRVGLFAEMVAMVLGRHVRIRTERPSPDIRFEVGR